jgi:hypothetical protein
MPPKVSQNQTQGEKKGYRDLFPWRKNKKDSKKSQGERNGKYSSLKIYDKSFRK